MGVGDCFDPRLAKRRGGSGESGRLGPIGTGLKLAGFSGLGWPPNRLGFVKRRTRLLQGTEPHRLISLLGYTAANSPADLCDDPAIASRTGASGISSRQRPLSLMLVPSRRRCAAMEPPTRSSIFARRGRARWQARRVALTGGTMAPQLVGQRESKISHRLSP